VFGAAAIRLAGFAGARLGWPPDTFWRATPAEFATVLQALLGPGVAPPLAAEELARLRSRFPD